MLNTLDEIYRHHRLMEVYPPDKQIDPNDEFSYDIKDQGELVTVRQDNLSEVSVALILLVSYEA